VGTSARGMGCDGHVERTRSQVVMSQLISRAAV